MIIHLNIIVHGRVQGVGFRQFAQRIASENSISGFCRNQSNGTVYIEIETTQVLKNLKAVLQAAGAETSQVVKTTIYLIDLKDFEKVNKIYSKTFQQEICPARACVQVAALPKGARVEIDCVAWLK